MTDTFLLSIKKSPEIAISLLLSGDLPVIDRYAVADKAFWVACHSGNLSLVKSLLLSKDRKKSINIHASNDTAFHCACSSGNSELVKFLFSLEKEHGMIDIHSRGDFAFSAACASGNLETVTFLLF